MKKIQKFLGILALTSGIIFAGKPAHAFLLPPMPWDPTVDGLTSPLMVVTNVATGLNKAQSLFNEAALKAHNMVSAVKRAKMAISARDFSGLESVFNELERSTDDFAGTSQNVSEYVMSIPGVRKVDTSCDIADFSDKESIKGALHQLFMAYPSDEIAVKSRYAKYRSKFYAQNLVSVNTMSTAAIEELNSIRALTKPVAENLRKGEDGAKAGDNQLAVLEGDAVAAEVSDRIKQLQERVVGIEGVYKGSRYLYENIEPAPYVAPSDTKASNDIFDNKVKYASSQTLAFGQQKSDPEKYKYDAKKSALVPFVKAPDTGIASPFAGNEASLAELEKLTPIQDIATETLNIHNTMNNLLSHKQVAEDYRRQVQLHEKSIEDLKASEKCVIQYLDRYYTDSNRVWNGRFIGDLVNEYELRQGLSGWAINAFSVAKSEGFIPVDTDSFGVVDLGEEYDEDYKTVRDIDKPATLKNEVSGLLNPSTEEKIEKNNRESKMIAWNIGAQAAKILVADQYSAAPKFGAPKKKFPIWTDQKNFYNQYIDGKYENIKHYLETVDSRRSVINIAVALNKIETDLNIKSKKTAEEKNEEYRKGLERNRELVKIAKHLSSDFETALGKTQDTTELKKIEADHKARLSILENKLNESMKKYPPETAQTDAQKKAIASLKAQYKLDKENAEIKRDEAISNYEIKRVNKNFDDHLASLNAQEAASVVALRTEKSDALASALAQKDSALSPLQSQKDGLEARLDAASKVLNEYNTDIDILQREIQDAKTAAEFKRQDIENMKRYYGEEVNVEEFTETQYVDYEKTIVLPPKKEVTVDFVDIKKEGTGKEGTTSTYTKEVINVKETEETITPEVSQIPLDDKISVKDIETRSVEEPSDNAVETGIQLFRKRPNLKSDKVSFYKSSEYLRFAQEMQEDDGEEAKEEDSENTENVDPETVITREVVTETTESSYTTAGSDDEYVTKKIEGTKDVEQTETQTYTDVVETTVSKEMEGAADYAAKDAEEEALAQEQIVDTTGKNIAEIRELAVAQQEKIDAIRAQIAEVNEKISAVEAAYVNKASSIETQYDALIEKAQTDFAASQKELAEGNLSLLNLYIGKIDRTIASGSILGSALLSQVEGIIKHAEELVAEAEAYAKVLVDNARADIYALGDKIYLPNGSPEVVAIHANLIEDLKALNVAELVKSSAKIRAFSGYKVVMDALSTIYQSAIVEIACPDDICSSADEAYFVGLSGKARDMRAPKAPIDSYLPPLREVFHFDDVDYENVPKGAGGKVTREGFLSYGGEVPAIWRLILNEKVFVEKGVNLQEILNQGGEAITFLSGGIYPCNFGNYTVSINADTDKYIVNDRLPDNDYPNCAAIEVSGSKINFQGAYYNIYDIEGDVSGPSTVAHFSSLSDLLGFKFKKPSAKTISDNTSELGTFLQASGNDLKFSSVAYRVFSRLKEISTEVSKQDDSYKTSLKDEMYKRSPFDTNQFGDFLGFVEREQLQRQGKEEVELAMLEMKEELFATLKAIGFEPEDDLDLADEKDYKLVYSKLDGFKNENVTKGLKELNAINIGNSSVLKERTEKLRSVFDALQKDKDELVLLSDAILIGGDLDEAIKTEEANRSSLKKYTEKADEEFQKQLKSSPRPYCAIY